MCQQCRSLTGFVLQQFCYTEPNKCTNDQCTNTKRWELDAATSVFTDWQKVRIQEASADIPSGSMPRSLDVILRNEAVDKAKVQVVVVVVGMRLMSALFQAGDSSIFTGTLIVVPDVTQFNLPGVKAKGKSSSGGDGTRGLKQTGVRDLTYRLCFLASTVRLAELRSGSVNLREEEEDNVVDELTEEQKKTIFEMSQRPSIYADLTASVAPTVFGHDEIKRGLLLMLLGGVHKETVEGINLRGDINIWCVEERWKEGGRSLMREAPPPASWVTRPLPSRSSSSTWSSLCRAQYTRRARRRARPASPLPWPRTRIRASLTLRRERSCWQTTASAA